MDQSGPCAFDHAILTHTVLYCGILVVPLIALVNGWRWLSGAQKAAVSNQSIFLVLVSHLVLDLWTFEPDCLHTYKHQFLWPVWMGLDHEHICPHQWLHEWCD